MPRNGSGTYTLPSGNPVVTGTTISSTWANTTLSDIATALTQSIAKDGQTPITANLPMSSYKFTGLSAGSATGDSAQWDQLFNQGTEADIASASTVDIGAQTTNFLSVTGTTTITSFGTNYKGPRFLRFTGALQLTNSSTLALPTGANITTASGDSCIAVPKATSGTADGWKVVAYQRQDGSSVAGVADGSITTAKLANGVLSADSTGRAKMADQFTTYAKMQNVSATSRLLGRASSGAGVVEELALSGLSFSGTTLQADSLSTASGSAPSYSLRAWCNWQGTGTVAIRAAGNVGSITDNGAGDYTVNFTTAMSDNNYSAVVSAMLDATQPGTNAAFSIIYGNATYGNAYATGSIRIITIDYVSILKDALAINIQVAR